jgi:hypothetical protein
MTDREQQTVRVCLTGDSELLVGLVASVIVDCDVKGCGRKPSLPRLGDIIE